MKVDENGKEICDLDFYQGAEPFIDKVTNFPINVINEDILNKVKNIVNGDRVDSYGPPKESFKRIADYWNVYMNHTIGDRNILPKDVAMLMALFKLAREENKHKEDNIIDAIAYLVLYNNLIKEEINES